MSSYGNFSKKNRAVKDSNAFQSPQEKETNLVNETKIKDFENQKDRWREYCSYFRLTK
jgi:hypothetical protein